MKIDQRPTVKLELVITLDEQEAGALQALAGYGVEEFLKVFYEKMGKAYLQQYEAGLRSLFKVSFQCIPSYLDKARKAREVFDK